MRETGRYNATLEAEEEECGVCGVWCVCREAAECDGGET